MALFDEQLITEITTLLLQRQQQFATALGGDAASVDPEEAPIANSVRLLVQIANGELIRGEARRTQVEAVEGALCTLHDLLFGTALGTHIADSQRFLAE